QAKRTAVLAITTQVCEMSLDLDAGVLITEQAPITAVIQRMGRCNRHARRSQDPVGTVLIYPAPDERPYPTEQLEGVPEFVQHVARRGVLSQTDLEEALKVYGPNLVYPDKACRFLESGPYAMSGEATYRDIEEFTIPAVLDSDVNNFIDLRK